MSQNQEPAGLACPKATQLSVFRCLLGDAENPSEIGTQKHLVLFLEPLLLVWTPVPGKS